MKRQSIILLTLLLLTFLTFVPTSAQDIAPVPTYQFAIGADLFTEISSIAVAEDGTIYVLDAWNTTVYSFDPQGELIDSVDLNSNDAVALAWALAA